jgi:hypothetical protein
MSKKLGETLLISEELLKIYSPLSKNISVDKVYPYLHLAQPYFVEPIIGMALMNELQQQIDEDEITDVNKALLIKIAPVLANYATYLAMRSLTYSITEKGITRENSENSSTIDRNELGDYILNIKNLAEMHQEILIKYLCNCKDLYPLWRPENECNCSKYLPTDGESKVEKKYTVYFPKKSSACECTDNMIGKGETKKY